MVLLEIIFIHAKSKEQKGYYQEIYLSPSVYLLNCQVSFPLCSDPHYTPLVANKWRGFWASLK